MGHTLLIVDDHAGFRSYARALLESEGYTVVGESADGLTAVRDVAELDPDIVLLDIALPDIDGFAVCERLMASGSCPAVVLTSTRDRSTVQTRLASSRAHGFITKSELSGAALTALTR